MMVSSGGAIRVGISISLFDLESEAKNGLALLVFLTSMGNFGLWMVALMLGEQEQDQSTAGPDKPEFPVRAVRLGDIEFAEILDTSDPLDTGGAKQVSDSIARGPIL
eukprot:CAMPEP_0116861414 /NCGR_PEP_ID=MMETSP0418-20121206/23011_1 /TAXON_ID=1158023 /ORGANISM="Astrosyne radiata, Strain 13vi08-1A" /LENGTH=106 /DNA_ID=CAMNT_0004496037 /DNA_START=52 /DNA_END=372 /DNA_ORIENTATION=-